VTESTLQLRRILVTGGAGFIGSAVVRQLLEQGAHVLNLDRLGYASTPEALAAWGTDPHYRALRADVRDGDALGQALADFGPDSVLHLAAETHVDRSIDGPTPFLETNVVGTYSLLQSTLAYWRSLPPSRRERFRLVHVSTDEVFGSLGPNDPPFHAGSPYRPRSPYAASKAVADHHVRAWWETYGLPTIVTNCCNNFGPWQFPEKFLPVVVLRALAEAEVPIYGAGDQIRDWLYVEDHAAGLLAVLERGMPGQTYLFGARNELSNRALAELVCDLVDEIRPSAVKGGRRSLLTSVPDRPGHDSRYAIDPDSTQSALGWHAATGFHSALQSTVRWYVEHMEWVRTRLDRTGGYRRIGMGQAR
jgi:dTDP-glucose 4,6-dehydratase